ncbi:MAG: methyltransferase domain-containing protein [Clostridiales bacterium]|nr:methyltransferase domain-containing protein [Clostridiales bacterium]
MSFTKTLKVTNIVHGILGTKITRNSIAIDATMGNGYDTLFLLNHIGSNGKVYAFDIQEESLINTKKILQNNQINIEDNIQLILDGHENIYKYVEEKVDIVMYNLGYLPGGNKKIITKPSTTIKSLDIVLPLLKEGGIISIATYYGHPGGKDERDAIIEYTKNLDWNTYAVLKCDYHNYESMPISLIFIEKKLI